jgi:acetyl esterase/lipase
MIRTLGRSAAVFSACAVSAAAIWAAMPSDPPAPAARTNLVAAAAVTPATTQASTRPSQNAVLADQCVVRKGIQYVVGGTDKQRLDVYAPVDRKGMPVVVFVHGGEWAKGDKADVSTKPRFFNERGVVFVSVNYRLSATDQHPAQVNDVAAAVRWCRTHIGEFGGDPEDVTLVGHSAGCHIVTLVGLDPRPLATVGLKPSDLKRVVSWSGGAFDLVQKVEEGGMYSGYIKLNFGSDASTWRDASPITHVANAKGGPAFLFVSAGDGKAASRQISEAMASKINAAGGHARPDLILGKTHFTINHELGAVGDESGEVLMRFIRAGTER